MIFTRHYQGDFAILLRHHQPLESYSVHPHDPFNEAVLQFRFLNGTEPCIRHFLGILLVNVRRCIPSCFAGT
jgi:hypothetical protein